MTMRARHGWNGRNASRHGRYAPNVALPRETVPRPLDHALQQVFKIQPLQHHDNDESQQLPRQEEHVIHPQKVHGRHPRQQDRQIQHGQPQQRVHPHLRAPQPQGRPDPPQRPGSRPHRRQQDPRALGTGELLPQGSTIPPPGPQA